MKPSLCVLAVAIALIASGCSFRDGVYVVLRPDAAAPLKHEFATWLEMRGFERTEHPASKGFVAVRREPSDRMLGLFASVHYEDGKHSLFLGKWNTRKFSPDEVAIVDECVSWLVSRAESLERGSVSRASSSEAKRVLFHRVIKKA